MKVKCNLRDTVRKNLSLVLLFVLVLIPVVTLSYFLFYDNLVARHHEEESKNLQMANVLAQNLDEYLAHTEASLKKLGTLEAVQTRDKPEVAKTFASMHLAEDEVSLYWVTDVEGNVIAKYPATAPDRSAAGKEFFQQAISGKTYVSDRLTGDMTGLDIILIAEPYYDKTGKVSGVIGASIPLSELQKKISSLNSGSSYPILVSKSGSFLAHPRLQEARQKVQTDDPIWQALRRGGSGTLDIVAPLDGKRKLFSYVPMKQADWVVVVIQPMNDFEAQLRQLFTRNTLVIFLVLLVVGLTARQFVLARNREEDARAAQAEKLAAVGQLAAGMAHEIRNPLTSIKGFVQMIASRPDGKFPVAYLETILEEIERIESIVSETLVLAKPTPTHFLPVNLSQVVREVCTLMEPQALLNHIDLSCTVTSNLPTILAEPNQLKQVFINLIKNSIEAIPIAGGKIDLEVGQQADKIQVSLKDTGCGMPQHLIRKLGNPFITTKENGTGLGLMVTYRIIQNHGGSIKVVSLPDQGTTFTLTFPITTVNPEDPSVKTDKSKE